MIMYTRICMHAYETPAYVSSGSGSC